jgi:hypothetical protein
MVTARIQVHGRLVRLGPDQLEQPGQLIERRGQDHVVAGVGRAGNAVITLP